MSKNQSEFFNDMSADELRELFGNSKTPLADFWNTYAAANIPEGTCEHCVNLWRDYFFFGAGWLFTFFTVEGDIEGLSAEQALADQVSLQDVHDAVRSEVAAYNQRMTAERAFSHIDTSRVN